MAIKHRPKVGELLECDFGQWQEIEKKPDYNRHLEPEMRKRRMVVVLNANLDGKSALVVPISSTKSYGRQATFHHLIDTNLIKVTDFYDKRDRWALAEHTKVVSFTRLQYIFDGPIKLDQTLPSEVVTQIQLKVIKAINAQRILDNLQKQIDDQQKLIDELKNELESLKNQF